MYASFINANGKQLNPQARNPLFLFHDMPGLKYLQKCFIIDLCAILIDYREASVFQTIARSLAVINCDETVLIGTWNERAA